MNDLISKQALKEDLLKRGFYPVIVKCALENAPAVDAVVLPCKIGDTVWGIAEQFGRIKAREGVVPQMYFGENMEIVIIVKNVATGLWGKKIFAAKEECERAIRERKENG